MYMFIYLEAVRILPFQVFVEGSSCIHDELYHWPGVVSPAFSPFSFLEVGGLGPKDQTLIRPWSSIDKLLSLNCLEGPLLVTLFESDIHHSRNSNNFRFCTPGDEGMDTKCTFYNIIIQVALYYFCNYHIKLNL